MNFKKYLTVFLQEMQSNVRQINQMLVDLERKPNNIDLLQEIMRVCHSCKGACKMMKFNKTADLCHALEDVFDEARHGTKNIDTLATDLCLAGLDEMEASFSLIEKTEQELEGIETTELLRSWIQGEKIDANALQTLNSKKAKSLDDELFTKIPSITVDTKKLDDLLNLVGEISLLQLQMKRSAKAQDDDFYSQFERLTTELSEKVIESRLVNLELVFSRFPRLVRDLAQSQGKKIQFEMTGVDYELDKTLVDHLVSPLIHLLRNAVDHGIELPAERTKAGKKEEGHIRLALYQAEGFTVVSVQDDGAAIDVQQLKAIAKKKGVPDDFLATIHEDTVLDLLCHPGFSSSETVTEVSGRGVGMSVVRETIQALGGRLELSLHPKKFTIMLPLQLSIIRGLLVQDSEEIYTIPFIHVQRLLRMPKSECRSQLHTHAAVIDNEDIPLVSLHSAITESKDTGHMEDNDTDVLNVVLTQTQYGKVGLVVDSILESRDVLVKPMPKEIENVQFYSGSTILDTGAVSMILDVPHTMQSVQDYFSTLYNNE